VPISAVTASVSGPRRPTPALLSRHSSGGGAAKQPESGLHISADKSIAWREGSITAAMTWGNGAAVTNTGCNSQLAEPHGNLNLR